MKMTEIKTVEIPAPKVILKGDWGGLVYAISTYFVTVDEHEKAVEKEITERAEKMVKRFQELNTDPLRIGEKARQRSDFNRQQWKEQYSQMEIKIEADVHAVQSGIIE